MGLFARVLVDIDLLSPLLDQLLVECSDFVFLADVEYEWSLHSTLTVR